MAAFSCAAKRFGRAVVAVLIAGCAAYATKDPKFIMLAPLIQAVAKYLRTRFDISHMPV